MSLQRPLRVLCAREVQKSIADSVKRLLDDDIERMGLRSFFDPTLTEIRTAIGGLFIFAGLRSNIEAIKSTEGIDIAWIEEANTVSQASINTLVPTVRKEGSEIWFSWNPSNEKDPVDKMFRGATPPPDAIVRKVTWEDNPWFPEVLRKEMEWDRSRDPEKYAHIWLGEYVRNSEARVFRNWKIDTFEVPKNARPYYGGDWGFAVDPTCLVRCWIVGRTLYIDQEAYEVGCPIDRTPALFDKVEGAKKWPITADSARPETIDYMRRHGYPHIQSARKGPGSLEDGVEFLKSMDIIIHPDCRHISDEFGNYSYKTDKLTGEVLPVLEDKKNHCIAEGTAVECERGSIPIEHVVEGDMVLTRVGYRRVVFSGLTDVDRKIVLVTTTGGSLACTPDHEIYTARGFARADALRYGDEIINLRQSEWWSASNGTAKSIADILKARTSRIGSISAGPTTGARTCFTERFGRALTDAFQRVTKSITSMVIPATTTLPIWSVCRAASTRAATHGATTAGENSVNTWTAYGTSQRGGTPVQKAAGSTRRLAGWLIGILSQSQSSAQPVARHSFRELSATGICTAPTLANRRAAANQASMTLSGFARSAARRFALIATRRARLVPGRVLTVSEHGLCARVYDLTIEGQHEFVAGGVLVSNCVDAVRYALEGMRVMDGGMVYSASEKTIVVPPISMPKHWPRIWAMDIDGAKASVLWATHDKESDTLYVYAECVTNRSELSLVADAIRTRGLWIPGLFDHLGRGRSKQEGARIAEALLDLKLDVFTVACDPEAAIAEVSRRFTGKRLKVFDTCSEWVSQYRSYRRDKDGDLVEESDGLMRCLDLLALSGPMISASSPESQADAQDDWSAQTRDAVTGY